MIDQETVAYYDMIGAPLSVARKQPNIVTLNQPEVLPEYSASVARWMERSRPNVITVAPLTLELKKP